jgi:hypothetical protein
MPINIKECDGGIGFIIESRGTVTDQELIDSLGRHLAKDKDKFKTYKYILIDQTALTTLDISEATIDHIFGLFADVSSINPDAIVAMVAYVSNGADIDLMNRISRMRELFIIRSCWESLQFLEPDLKQRDGSRERLMINLEFMIYHST